MAERVPFFTLFESFQAPRQLRLLLHDACIISGALDMAGRAPGGRGGKRETPPPAAQGAPPQQLGHSEGMRHGERRFCGRPGGQ